MTSFTGTRAPAVAQSGLSIEPAPARVGRRAVSLLGSPWLHASLLALGVALRLGRHLADRALWLDESYLALNLMHRSYTGLLGTLDFGQGAPAGFLLAQKLVVDTLGDGERALRLLPLLAGIVSLFLFYGVARRLLTPHAVPVAVLLFAVGEPFIAYSAELKQYVFDVAVALGILYLLLRVIERPRLGVREAVVLGVAGALAVFLSHPAVFVLAGTGIGALAHVLLRRDVYAVAALTIPLVTWLSSFFLMQRKTLQEIQHLEQASTEAAAATGSAVRNIYMLAYDLGLLHSAAVGLASALALVGVVSLWATPSKRPVLMGAGTMVGAMMLAGQVGKYPVGQRFALFLLPLGLIALAEGAVKLVRVLPRDLAATVTAVVVVMILLPPLGRAGQNLVIPPAREEIKPVLAYIGERWLDGDTLYVFSASHYALRYYLECSSCRDAVPPQLRSALRVRPNHGPTQASPALLSESSKVVISRLAPGRQADYVASVEELRGRKRVWALYGHYVYWSRLQLAEPFERLGRRIDCSPRYGGSYACLYDLSQHPPDSLGRAAWSRAAPTVR